jgi:hypothetical protein
MKERERGEIDNGAIKRQNETWKRQIQRVMDTGFVRARDRKKVRKGR